MATTGVIQMIAREGWTPVAQNSHQAPSGDVSFHLVFRQISKSEPCARSVQAQGYVIENKLPLDMHFELALVLLEFLGVETTIGG